MERASHILLTLLLNSAWQIALVFAMASLCSLLLRRAPAKYRHALWIAALMLSVLLPASSVRHIVATQAVSDSSLQNVEVPFRISVSGNAQQAQNSFHLPHVPPVPVAPTIRWIVVACYFAFLMYRVGRIAWAWWRTVGLQSMAGQSANSLALINIVDRYAAAFKLKRTPPVYLSGSVGPVTIGAFRPILLVPASFSESASEAQLASAVGHELAHIRRHDFLLNLACELISLPVSFHPAVRLIKSRIERTRYPCRSASKLSLSFTECLRCCGTTTTHPRITRHQVSELLHNHFGRRQFSTVDGVPPGLGIVGCSALLHCRSSSVSCCGRAGARRQIAAC